MALGAGAVAAGVEDVQQGAAVVAAPLLSAECFGAAGEDVGEGATMRGQHRRVMSLQIAAPETTENVRQFGHGVTGCSSTCRATCARTPASVLSDACTSPSWRCARGREASARRGCPPSSPGAGWHMSAAYSELGITQSVFSLAARH